MFNLFDVSVRKLRGESRKKPNYKPRRRISVEPLESRWMLAANVVVSGNNVTVTGGANADILQVVAVQGTIVINDAGTGIAAPTGLSNIGTLTINTLGGSDQVVVNLPQQDISIGTLNINTADGDDFVFLSRGNVTGSATVNTGSGVDTVISTGLVVVQNVNINTDADTDIVYYGGVVGQNLTINTGPGLSLVTLNGRFRDGEDDFVSTSLQVGNNVLITGGSDSDYVSTGEGSQTVIGGNLTVNTLAGNDRVAVGRTARTTVGNDLNVTTADGNDFIQTGPSAVASVASGDDGAAVGFGGVAARVTVGRNLRQDSGPGNDRNTVRNTLVAGTLDLLDPAGTNTLLLVDVSVTGNATVSGGSGQDFIGVRVTGGGQSVFSGNLTVRGNAGDDTVTFDTFRPNGALGIIVAAGYSHLTLDGGPGTDRLTPLAAFGGVSNGVVLDLLGANVTSFEIFA